MAAIVYSTSPSRVSTTNQNQYGSYGSVNSKTLHHQSQQHHHTMHPSSSAAAPPPLSIYQAKEHHNNYFMSRNYKRKSAVELLAETKSYYVKSENVLDRHQQLSARNAGNNTLSFALSPSRVPPSPHHSYYHQTSTMERYPRSSSNRRSASSGSDLLQTKLRRLLNTEKDIMASSDDNILIPPPPKNYNDLYQQHRSPKNYQKQLTVHPTPDSQNDVNVFFPSAFLSPQSLPPHPSEDLDVIYSYTINDHDEFLERPISPPEQYQTNTAPKKGKIKKEKQRYDYQRSHSQTMAAADEYDHKPSRRNMKDSRSTSNNINSHKSLPDLHTQISRHSPHSEYSSRGNRSNRSGSSGFNRDSGGSSGHFTHRSEPCCKQMEKIMMNQQQQQSSNQQQQDYRRDSGSSTQHSGNSFYTYQQQFRYDCIECRAKMRENETTMFNFPVEVPEAFQDSYQESSDTLRNTYYNQQTSASIIRSPSPQDVLSPSSQKMELSPLSPPLGTFKRQKCLRFKNFRYSNSTNVAQTSTSQPNSLQIQAEDDRRPILRSKSDISDRYWNKVQQQQQQSMDMSVKSRRERYQQTVSESFGSNGSGASSGGKLSRSDSMYELEHFFDQLGLDDKNYQETIARPRRRHQRSASATVTATFEDNDSDRSSVVFFSDCSTIDSNRIIADSGPTIQTDQTNPNLYRPSEPPSIVERNARIIKWLCNCKKSQML
ncbi:hypothetical protein PVAND_008912 [Polypedilum vanderplanki]|uniref:Centrosome-associated FAM110 C-terminal domain-containing protein n=1 Tax=Polypedilum vanderplanki TaxID=319348 RepID=A0A9J6CB36_POLVA|nr:hypothetical protein PVAND_008912 [Polypedilum vanderplanki]